MKIRMTIALVLLLSLLLGGNLFAQSYNYEEMTQEQYNAYLAEWQGRLDAAEGTISDEEAQMAELQKELEALQGDIDQTWEELYVAGGADEPAYNSYGDELDQFKADAQAFANLPPEEIYSRMGEIDEMQAKLDELKQNAYGATSENEAKINSIQNLLNQATQKGKAVIPPSYTVQRGDYLWKIASMPDIYGDAYAWMRIYTSNRDQIKDPDMIFPNQIFNIPRVVGPNEHLVMKGEFLSKIAGYSNVYGSPFQWQKLYEANKEVVQDPSMIYPHMVLKISR